MIKCEKRDSHKSSVTHIVCVCVCVCVYIYIYIMVDTLLQGPLLNFPTLVEISLLPT